MQIITFSLVTTKGIASFWKWPCSNFATLILGNPYPKMKVFNFEVQMESNVSILEILPRYT
jgi:hypothetical protein